MSGPFLGVVAATTEDVETAQLLANRLQNSGFDPRSVFHASGVFQMGKELDGWVLWVDEHGPAIQRLGQRPRPQPVRACLQGHEISQRVKNGPQELLARATGLTKRGELNLTILDATAGLGRDAAVLAALGAEVRLMERHPLLHLLLEDARNRCSATYASRLQLLPCMDACTWLSQSSECYDVIYVDPMFPERNKTALAGRELQMLRDVLPNEEQPEALLPLALTAARHRVVVKRHPQAAPLKGRQPTFQLVGNRVRYDVYQN